MACMPEFDPLSAFANGSFAAASRARPFQWGKIFRLDLRTKLSAADELSVVPDNRTAFDLNPCSRPRQCRHCQRCAGWGIYMKEFHICGVHFREVGHVLQEDRALPDIAHSGPRCLQRRANVLERLSSLDRYTAINDFLCSGFDTRHSRYEYQIAIADNNRIGRDQR